MTGFEIYRLVFKVLGVFGIFKALETTQLFVVMFSLDGAKDPMFFTQLFSGILPFVLLTLVGIFLWKRSDSLARVVSTSSKSHSESRVTNTTAIMDIQTAAFTAMGLYILVISVPSLVQIISYNLIIDTQQHVPDYMKASRIPELLKLGTQLAFGFWLLLGSNGIVKVVNTLRNAGVKEKL